MYIAALRIADDFGCDAHRHPVSAGPQGHGPRLRPGRRPPQQCPPARPCTPKAPTGELYPGGPLVHFNEVDECAGVDGLITNRVLDRPRLRPLEHPPRRPLGEHYQGADLDDFIWVFQISGASPAKPLHRPASKVPPASVSPPCTSPSAAEPSKASAKPGPIVWSRVFVESGALHCESRPWHRRHLYPPEETERRWRETTYQWPIMHAKLHGIDRNQFMGRHRANHIQVAYAPDPQGALIALQTKAAMLQSLGPSGPPLRPPWRPDTI